MKAFSKHWISSKKPKKQRKYRYNAPLHLRGRFLQVHLSKELREKYKRRAVRVITGDKIKVVRGDYRGITGKVVKVDLKGVKVYVDNLKRKKADGTEVRVPLSPSNLMITDLNLKDSKRVQKLKRE